MAIGGFARDGDGQIVGRSAAEAAWVPAAREILAEVAGSAYATIGVHEFTERVQARSGVQALGPASKWLGHCLTAVARACASDGHPLLVSLVASNEAGRVGEGYDACLLAYGLAVPDGGRERERVAAEHRLDCYRWAGAPEPTGGWFARGGRTTTIPRASRTTRGPSVRSSSAQVDAPVRTCPRCFMALPASGQCDYCA